MVTIHEGAELDSKAIERVLEAWTMKSQIEDPEARIFTNSVGFVDRLIQIGHCDLIHQNTYHAVCLLSSKLQPRGLKRKVRESMELDESQE